MESSIEYTFFSNPVAKSAWPGFFYKGTYCPFHLFSDMESSRVVRPLPQLKGEEDAFDSPLIAELCRDKLTAKEVRTAMSGADYVFFATSGNMLRGFAIAHLRQHHLYVDILVGSGCGGKLMDYLQSMVSQHPSRLDSILLESIPPAIGFYLKKGFVPTGLYSKEGYPYYTWNIIVKEYQRESSWSPNNALIYDKFQPMLLI